MSWPKSTLLPQREGSTLLPQREGSLASTMASPSVEVVGAIGLENLHDAYDLSVRLGGGADGQVLRGIVRGGPDAGRWDAIKRFRTSAYDPSRELRILKLVQQHPNVLRLLGVYKDGDTMAFSSPEMDMDLHVFMARRRGGLAATQAVSFCKQLLLGLQHIHSLRVVHMDVKPGNIFLRVEPDGVNLQLADFSRARGIALPQRKQCWVPLRVGLGDDVVHLVDALQPKKVMMTAGVCTPQYDAPECVFCKDGVCKATTSIDMWSCGLVAYEMRASDCFMRGDNQAALWQCAAGRIGQPQENLGPLHNTIFGTKAKVTGAPVKSLEQVATDWGEAYSKIVRGCCVWRPDQRHTATSALLLIDTVGVAATHSSSLGKGVVAATHSSSRTHKRSPPSPGGDANAKKPRTAPDAESVKAWMARCRETVTHAHPQDKPLATSRKKCQCSGHCNQSGHRRNGCSNMAAVLGSKNCVRCMCVVPGCVAPRLKSDFCSAHSKILGEQPLALQCVRATCDWWQETIPCDVLAFVDQWPLLQQHPVLALVAAIIKEPTALKAWQDTALFTPFAATQGSGQRGRIDPQVLLDSLLVMLQAVDKCPNTVEVEQLGRNGVARFLGPRAACVTLGVLSQTSVAATPGVYMLGKANTPHCVRKGALETLQKIILAAEAAWQDWETVQTSTDVVAISSAAARVLTHIGNTVPKTFPVTDKHCYVRLHIVRKCVLARASCRHADAAPFDWATVTLDELGNIGPDERNWLSYFPDDWTAETIGSYMLKSRGSGVFVPMLACLWRKWADAASRHRPESAEATLAKQVQESRGRSSEFWARHGIPPHPVTLMGFKVRDPP